MKKIIFALVTLAFISCQNKEVLLPELDKTIVQDVDNHSLIYFFFKTEKKRHYYRRKSQQYNKFYQLDF
jgi:hypothetical protein